MRIAALSDIHSNVFALEAVIADLKQRGADVVVNLGDILYGPIEPRSTYDLLMENKIISSLFVAIKTGKYTKPRLLRLSQIQHCNLS